MALASSDDEEELRALNVVVAPKAAAAASSSKGKGKRPVHVHDDDDDSDDEPTKRQAAGPSAASVACEECGGTPCECLAMLRAHNVPQCEWTEEQLAMRDKEEEEAKVAEEEEVVEDLAVDPPRPKEWEDENQEDVEEIRKWIRANRQSIAEREEEEKQGFDKKEFPAWRCDPVTRVHYTHKQYGYQAVLRMGNRRDPANANFFVPYDELFAAGQLADEMLMLGCNENSSYLGENFGFLRWSNYETQTLEYIYENLHTMLSRVPLYIGGHRSTAAQRLGSAIKGVTLPIDAKCMMQAKRNTSLPSDVQAFGTNKDVKRAIYFNRDPPGTGKTEGTIVQAMKSIVTDAAWKQVSDAFAATAIRGVPLEHNGLLEMHPEGTGSKSALCRVAVALVPETLMGQWEATASAVSRSFREEFGKGFVVWTGTHCVQRACKSQNRQSIKRVMSVAHQLTHDSNEALLWILPATTDASRKAFTDAPHLTIWYRIYDEMTGERGTEPRGAGTGSLEHSPCMNNVIVNATVQQLESRTDAQPTHPLRLALGNERLSMLCARHVAIIALCSPPEWMRRFTGSSMAPTMPSGIRKIALPVKVQSLAGRVNETDLVITDTGSLLEQMLDSTSGGFSRGMLPQERKEFLKRVQGMLGQAVEGGDDEAAAAKNEDKSIRERLVEAVRTTKDDFNALPPMHIAPQPINGMKQHLTQEQSLENSERARMRQAYMSMLRLFERLLEALACDPPPECPITLMPIEDKYLCILGCCCGIIDKRSVQQLHTNKCPLCNQKMPKLLRLSQAMEALGQKPTKPDEEEQVPEPPRASLKGSADALVAEYERIAGLSCKSSLEAVLKAINLALDWKPHGLRVLLCFKASRQGNMDVPLTTCGMRQYLLEGARRLDSIETIKGKDKQVLADYKRHDGNNRVLVINTARESNTLVGFDLGNTDVTVFDCTPKYGAVSNATMVQGIGRAMRPQKCSKEESAANRAYYREHGKSKWAPKIVLTLIRA